MSMQNPLNASAMTAGALMSTSTFEVPIYQREYAWTVDEVKDFWSDIDEAQKGDSYFLGLLILTKEHERYHVVDGQQRILTLTVLAAVIREHALANGRKALADKIRSDFLKTINYETDETQSRVVLADKADNQTLQSIIDGKYDPDASDGREFSKKIGQAYEYLSGKLAEEISSDPFKKLGNWAEFITDKLYFAVFIHPDARSAYKVFEAINTRGRDLTTAELLKNFVLSQTKQSERKARYEAWQSIAHQFPSDGSNSFVQFIRHAVTVEVGHVLPKDLFDLIAGRGAFTKFKGRPTIDRLMEILASNVSRYSQMVDPSSPGPVDENALKVFDALNSLSVLSVRPIMLSLLEFEEDCVTALRDLLRLVVARIVVGNLGTGNVERRFGEAAKQIRLGASWAQVKRDFVDLTPSREDFEAQLSKRSFNKQVLAFVRRSIIDLSITPDQRDYFHLVRPKQLTDWPGFEPEDVTFWTNTIGNSVILSEPTRDRRATTWEGFKEFLLPLTAEGELTDELSEVDAWNAEAIEHMGRVAAARAAAVWY